MEPTKRTFSLSISFSFIVVSLTKLKRCEKFTLRTTLPHCHCPTTLRFMRTAWLHGSAQHRHRLISLEKRIHIFCFDSPLSSIHYTLFSMMRSGDFEHCDCQIRGPLLSAPRQWKRYLTLVLQYLAKNVKEQKSILIRTTAQLVTRANEMFLNHLL